MKPALVLIDLQRDYLDAPGLQPSAGQIVHGARELLDACRALGVPVIHVWTTVHRSPDDRMEHWKRADKWICEEGAPGQRPPAALEPRPAESVVHKQHFSAFSAGRMDAQVRAAGCDALLLAGVHVHGCIRATALDAYARGLTVWVADDAVGSDDPLHAAITRRYLDERHVRFAGTARLRSMLKGEWAQQPRVMEHHSPCTGRVLWSMPVDDPARVARAAQAARAAASTGPESLVCLAGELEREVEELARIIAREVGKPIAMARDEVRRSAAILRAVADLDLPPGTDTQGARYRYRPLGLVAVVTPWNNPLAIPLGKIAPALRYGNTVAWKPAPAGTVVAQRLLELWHRAGLPRDTVTLCPGDHETALALARDACVDGVTISGSLPAGYALQEICARRHVPFQGELGGNNAAIICDDADLPDAARQIALGAFGFAGQRCTANRRAIVMERCYRAFVDELARATQRLVWGDPMDDATTVGPVIGVRKREQVVALLERARETELEVLTPHARQENRARLMEAGAYLEPAIVLCDRPQDEIVQEETFGPVLVVERAADMHHALELCNAVRQGLAAAIFSPAPGRQEQFLRTARAGVLKINRDTSGADATSPLGGWKASGVGPAEHGVCDREFFCRVQTVYAG